MFTDEDRADARFPCDFVKSCMFVCEVKPSWKVTCMNMVPCPLVMFDEGGVVGCGVVECGVVWCGGVVWCECYRCGVVWCGVVWWVWCGERLQV